MDNLPVDQEHLWEQGELFKSMCGSRQKRLKYLQGWVSLVKSICISRWNWLRGFVGTGGPGQQGPRGA